MVEHREARRGRDATRIAEFEDGLWGGGTGESAGSETKGFEVLLMERIGKYSFDEYVELVKSFHGYAAPGLIMGGFMVDLDLSRLPRGVLF